MSSAFRVSGTCVWRGISLSVLELEEQLIRKKKKMHGVRILKLTFIEILETSSRAAHLLLKGMVPTVNQALRRLRRGADPKARMPKNIGNGPNFIWKQ